MNLYEATRHLHHSAEKHPFAKSMIDGTISKQNWCDWLNALQQIHYAIDPYVPDYAKRTHSLNHDLILMLPVTPINYESTKKYISQLNNTINISGAAYIFLGAHRRGGRVIAKAMNECGLNLPNNHVHFDESQKIELYIKQLREYEHLKDGAELAFKSIIEIFDDIIKSAHHVLEH